MAAPSSSSSAAAPKKYDVFISFRGEDTREGFTAHLYNALCESSIEAYIDRELNKGDEIAPSLFQAIQDSYGSLVVFSENYATSKWCLNELVKILEYRKQGHFVIPVFYNIDPSALRKQKGSYGNAFAEHEKDPKNRTMLENWKAALAEAANIAGWDSKSRNHRDEPELIRNIVIDVSQKLVHIDEPRKLGFVGIDRRCEHIEALLREFPVVGMWGMGGIGKTTLARAVFDKLFSQYDSCCFLENIREESQRRGANELRARLLQELLKNEVISINLHKAEGLEHAMRKLSNKKVLIVLDDVNNFEQLEHLGLECKSLGPKSRLVITTRDKHMLTSLIDKPEIYEVKGLDVEESFELFKSKAFNERFLEKGYEEITKKIVSYTQGIPLALKILGLFLLSKTREEWESEWKKLKKIPNEEVGKVLKLSFDGLSYENKQIFLDIACFLKGEDKEKVISLLDSYGFYGATGIRTLQDRALITLSSGNEVQMHDLMQEMGWQIVREESLGDFGRRSRLWDPEEVYHVLKHNKGTRKVEGIILDMSQIKDLHLSAKTFKKMINLRYLKFYSNNFEEPSRIHVPVDTQLFSDKLSYFCWDKCPLRSLSSNFCAEKLVELNMPNCKVKKLWKGVQNLENLKSLDLSGSKKLKKLPNLSKASSLKSVRLSECTNLRHIHPSILSSHTLEDLDVSRCKKLTSLQSEVHLKSLKDLNIGYCSSLREFSLSSENIIELRIEGTAVDILHSSLMLCKNLKTLLLSDSFKIISSDLKKLTSLRYLFIYRCPELDTLNLQHIMHGSLLSLREITLFDCLNLSHLPDDIKHFPHLTLLIICNCKRLSYISELPASIGMVDMSGCTSLETMMAPESVKYKKTNYFLRNCVKLDEHSLSSIMESSYSIIKQAAAGALCEDDGNGYCFSDINIYVPGNRVPSWFGYKAAQNCISIEIPPYSRLLGLAFYCILSPEFLPHRGKYLIQWRCDCYLENSHSTVLKNMYEFEEKLDSEMISDHVFMWYDQSRCSRFVDEMKIRKAVGQRTKRLCFEFYVQTGSVDRCEIVRIDKGIKECGVWPLYASEYDISINDLELREGIKLGYRTDDINEQVELQFDALRPIFDFRDRDISSQNARQDLSEINSLCPLNRFNELDYSTSQMELNLELGFGNKSKRCRDIDEHQPFQRKKFSRCQDIGELLGGANASGIGVGCSEFALQPLTQTNTMNEFVFQPPLTDISKQNAWLDSTQMNSTHLPDRFSEYENNLTQLSPTGFCPDFNEIATSGNSLDIDQQSVWFNQGHPQTNPSDTGVNSNLYALSSSCLPDIAQMVQANNLLGASSFWSNQGHLQMNPFDIGASSGPYTLSSSSGFLDIVQMAQANHGIGSPSFWFNQGHPQINPFDIGANSGLFISSSSSSLTDIVHMAQANNVYDSPSFCFNQEDPQMNLLEGIEVGGSYQDNQHEQELLVTSNGIDEIHPPSTSYRNPDAE